MLGSEAHSEAPRPEGDEGRAGLWKQKRGFGLFT